MAIDTNNVIDGANGRPTTPLNADADRQEIKHLAQQFEALLMTQMMREMRKSLLDDGDEEKDGLGLDAMTDTGDIAFGDAMSQQGGLGMTTQLLEAFQRQIAALSAKSGVDGAASNGSVTRGSLVPDLMPLLTNAPAALPSLNEMMPLNVDGARGAQSQRQAVPGAGVQPRDVTVDVPVGKARGVLSNLEGAPVSSAFGWRRDPMTGTSRFHAGVDIAVAYGRDVKAAAEGVVAFAGQQGGYGNTVVIDHGAGRQTRYAHLSQPTVREGERVAEGQIVGKSGNSGRSTGPHLHFEMLVNGQAVNPLGGNT